MRHRLPAVLVLTGLAALACGGPETEPPTVPDGPTDVLHPTLVGPESASFDPDAKDTVFEAIDGDPATAWRAAEPAWFEFRKPVTLTAIEILPGCAASAETWASEPRAARVRYRLATREPGATDSVFQDWTESPVSSSNIFMAPDMLTARLGVDAAAVVGVELEVLEPDAAPCVAEVRFLGGRTESEEAPGAPWRLVERSRYHPMHFELQGDAWPAQGRFDFDACALMGADGSSDFDAWAYEGACEQVDGGVRLAGKKRFRNGKSTAIAAVLPVRELNPCLALIGGAPHARQGCGP